MRLSVKAIINYVGQSDYEKGLEYLNKGYIKTYDEVEDGDVTNIYATVKRKSPYRVKLQYHKNYFQAYCDCMQYGYTRSCKHIAAVALASATYEPSSKAKKLINQYINRPAAINSVSTQKAHITPYISDVRNNEYPSFSFKVGYERPYVIKNIHEFLESFKTGETKTYGKNLTLKHSLTEFDDISVKIILILIDEFNDLKTYNNSHTESYYYH